ncbi:MAG: PRTRC system protein B [Bacteroidetes bacterium]|nr:PRTRC system protein B [Bacteroidota bacterium]
MINEGTTNPFNPIQAVIVYKKDSTYYLETHDILRGEDKFLWQEGRPFLKEQLKELSLSLGNSSFTPMEVKGLMPDNILHLQQTFFNTNIAWYLPPSKRVLHFKKELKLATGTILLPGLIFCVSNKTLTVVSVKGKNKPTLKTKVFKAPFHNIHSYGKVCMGNTGENKSKNILQEEMLRWERRFFNSYFSHFLDEKVVTKGTNLQILFKNLMKSQKPFPENVLVPSSFKTVEKLLKDFTK